MSVSLLDIGKLRATVNIRGVELVVTGIRARDLFTLMDMFPELRRMFGGQELRPEELFKQAPMAINSVLQFVLGVKPDNVPECDAIANMALGEQMEVVRAAWGLTFPRGISSFLDALEAMGVAPASTKGPGTTSHAQSNNSLPPATEQTTSGATPPDNSAPSPS